MMVKFLREHLEKAGCVVGENFIKAVHCDKQISGGNVHGEGVLLFCYSLSQLYLSSLSVSVFLHVSFSLFFSFFFSTSIIEELGKYQDRWHLGQILED
ncbi:hypothetical protein CIPAW_10G123000 [Carya illinoinensis]|uniref:Uncharacterized protein n=1 Tax=Carya illinoinensis TaxID=32201 RepID=A0A8T1P599_CARIL|nr:hypothetical protein CIPAW_10G123000 [Carya illinoinensis]KAG6692598.1 hypothetical protein I3842_10G122500 [Carya illinoinensis]